MIADKTYEQVVPLSSETSVRDALQQLRDAGLEGLPVTEEGRYLGNVTAADLIMVANPELPLSSFKNAFRPVAVAEEMHLLEVIRLGASNDQSHIPVVAADNRFLRTVTPQELLRQFSSMVDLDQPGSIIVLEFREADYSMSEILQVVESNETRILLYWVRPNPVSGMVEITLKVNRTGIGPLLQAFYRLNYLVKASWSLEDAYHEGLRDRFDALMNYLSI